jgi:tetratricopeptide (TPR) repeat protein
MTDNMELSETERQFRESLGVHGALHPSTVDALVSLVRELRQRRENNRAKQILLDFLEDITVTDNSSPLLLRANFQLGLVLENLHEFREAERIWTSVLEQSDREMGLHDDFSLRASINLANVLRQLKDYRREQSLRERILESAVSKHGEDSVDAYRSLADLATNLDNQREYLRAYELNSLVVDGFKRHNLPEKDRMTREWLMANELLQLGKGGEAEALFQEVLRQTQDLEPGDPFRKQAEKQKKIYRVMGRISRSK